MTAVGIEVLKSSNVGWLDFLDKAELVEVPIFSALQELFDRASGSVTTIFLGIPEPANDEGRFVVEDFEYLLTEYLLSTTKLSSRPPIYFGTSNLRSVSHRNPDYAQAIPF
ncbi:hypothetical protein VNI00_002852 [Paramarasmius palmivorus]|uniref:Uncharacterized protein n=1 Tax=Paramarasmius palmivorus TaxID=297713 RepID=A0AAW0DU32_9AGAR